MNRLEEIANELHDIANSYAGEKTGIEASLLHLSANNINTVLQSLKGETPINPTEVVARYNDWSFRLFLLENL